MESPVDHTSAHIVYSLPVMRSGWNRVARRKHGHRAAVIHSHRHVLGRPSESTRPRADELSGNAKVTEFDHALAREEDVGRLDIPVDDFLGMQIREALQDLSSGWSSTGDNDQR